MNLKKSFEEYLAIDAQNFSLLKEMAKSPLHYLYRTKNQLEDSTVMAKGRAIHTAVLEPELFMSEYVVFIGKTRRGKEWDAFSEEHKDKTILKVDEAEKVLAAAAAVKRHPEVIKLMKKGKPEQSFTWKDEKTGLKCKCRVDWLGDELFDLKSTSTVDARFFGNQVARMLYYAQVAMYRDGAKHAGPVLIIGVEVEPPFDVGVYELTEDDLFAGQELYQGFLQRVVECKKSGQWPGRYPERQKLEMPRYVFEDEDQEDGTAVVVTDDEEAA